MIRLMLLACALGGCARFVDERPAAMDVPDLTPEGAADLSPGPSDAGDTVLASGVFVQAVKNGGDTGSGSVALVRGADGVERVVFGADFTSTPLPAGEVVLTSRTSIGAAGIEPGVDLDLGRLVSAKGAQTYMVPADDGTRRNVLVYCVTFGVDVAIGVLQ